MTYQRLNLKQLALAGLCGFGLATVSAIATPASSSAQSPESSPMAQDSAPIEAPTLEQPSAVDQPGTLQQPDAPQPGTVQQPAVIQQPTVIQQPGTVEPPNTVQQPDAIQQPGTIQQPSTVQQPGADQPSTVQQPGSEQVPGTVQTPDTVQEPGNLVEVAGSNGSFKTLISAIQAAGLSESLASGGPFTVFAPTDEAFAALPAGVLNALLLPGNRDLLTQVLAYHVVPGAVTSDELTTGGVETLNGGLAVRVEPDQVVVNDASVVTPDVAASNGVIHAINRVLIPDGLVEELQSRTASSTTTEPAPGL